MPSGGRTRSRRRRRCWYCWRCWPWWGWAACRRMFGPLNRMVACMKDVAQGEGDLTRRLEVPPDREVAELAGWFNTFIDRLRGILLSVAANVHHLAAAGEELSVNSRQQAQGAEQQKSQIQQVAT